MIAPVIESGTPRSAVNDSDYYTTECIRNILLEVDYFTSYTIALLHLIIFELCIGKNLELTEGGLVVIIPKFCLHLMRNIANNFNEINR
jgi:hypothetical protein